MRWNFKKISWLAWLWFGIMLIVVLASLPEVLERQNTQGSLLKTIHVVLSMTISLAFPLVGALIVSRRSENTIGWLLMAPSLAALLDPFTQSQIAGLANPPTHPSVLFWIAIYLSNAYWLLAIFPIFLIALLFPTGRPLSPRWRWVVNLAIGLFVFFLSVAIFDKTLAPDASIYGVDWSIPNPLGFLDTSAQESLFSIWLAGMAVLALLSVISIVLRYQRAGIVEREQIKWLLYAVGLFVTFYATSLFAQTWGQEGLVSIFISLFMLAIPIAIGIAILRYRLFDIDLIIRKTLQYALLTGLLALVYFGSVILLQSLSENLFGEQSPLVIVLSTLGIAGLFSPLRIRVQDFIDQRFFRQKYDAEKALAAFAVAARNETDLEQLSGLLTGTVQEALQPERVGLWLKTETRRSDHES